tara:strand:- start:6028 stop:6414 length:387 start_codon:yes stop_codon:yes gene_type:complete
MDKETMLNMSYDELQSYIDPDHWEYLDHMKDIVGFPVEDREACWKDFEKEITKGEQVLGQYFNRLSKEEAWELYDYRSFSEIEQDEYDAEKSEKYDNHTLQIMQWHHIEPVEDPYWKQCVDIIEEKLK